ncbi:hypothetical protein QZH41_015574, partial [Actinostola sp. cb2023]
TNNEGRLYLSRDEHNEHKSLIASVTGVRFVDPLSYDKYSEQRSFPVLLKKGEYYYMETLMKEYFNEDNLDVSVKTPDGKMHAPITSDFLWTAVSGGNGMLQIQF